MHVTTYCYYHSQKLVWSNIKLLKNITFARQEIDPTDLSQATDMIPFVHWRTCSIHTDTENTTVTPQHQPVPVTRSAAQRNATQLVSGATNINKKPVLPKKEDRVPMNEFPCDKSQMSLSAFTDSSVWFTDPGCLRNFQSKCPQSRAKNIHNRHAV